MVVQYKVKQEEIVADDEKGMLPGVRREIDKAIEKKITPQFNTVNKRFDKIDERFDKMDKVLSEILLRLPPSPSS